MKGRITIICENTVTVKGGIGEHGFSAYVETERGNFLFDTGRGDALIHNLLAFDKDPLAIQKIFLSHGHQDHTGGLPAILGVLGGVDILAHPDIFSVRYNISKKDGKIPCAMAFKIAKECNVSTKEIGNLLNQVKIKISNCQLGCF